MPPCISKKKKIMGLTIGAGTALAAGIGAFATGATAAANAGATAKARAENHRYNEMSADAADARTRALYKDLYSPNAQVKQLQEAGLNPAILYGMQGGVGQATPHGAQGAGVNVAPNIYDFNAAMQNALIAAQIENINADTKGKNIKNNVDEATALETAYANLDQIFADAGLKRAQTNLTQLKATKQEIDNLVSGTFDFAKANAELTKLNEQVENLIADARIKSVEATIAENTQETQIDKIKADLQNTYKDIQLKTAKEILTRAETDVARASKLNIEAGTEKWKVEAEEIGNRIIQKWTELDIEQQKTTNQKEWFEKTAQAELEKAAAATKNADTEEMRVIWHSVNESVDTARVLAKEIAGAVLTRGLSLGAPSTSERVTQNFDRQGNFKGETRTYQRTRPQNKQ